MGADQTRCFHCGDTCGASPLVYDHHPFCCQGCQTVYQILQEHNLCQYYTLSAQPGQKQASAVSPQFAYLDAPEMVDRLAVLRDPRSTTVVFRIPAIHCSSCIWLLEHVHRLHPGIGHAEVNFPRREVTVTYLHDQVRLSEVVSLLHKIGYSPQLNLDSADPAAHTSGAVDRKLLYKLGVAGFCFGNIMLLSFPDYLDTGAVQQQYQRLFNILNIVLGLPVFFYSGWDYVRSSWLGIRQRRFVIDQPLALGMVAMLGISLWEIGAGIGPGYLDSMAGLIFFLLLGRFFQAKTYAALAFDRDYKAYFPLSVLRKDAAGLSHPTLVSHLKPGDTIVVRNQEVVPTDGIVLSPYGGEVDYSFATGEQDPVPVKKGEMLYAGGRVQGTAIELSVLKATQQSHLTRLWNHPAFQKTYQAGHSQRLDRISKYFTIGILTIAGSAAAFWAPVDIHTALYAFTSVLVVACPCALAISTPFVFGHITRILGRNGLYLKHSAVVERLALVDTVVFDKTGTLTKPQARQLRFTASEGVMTDEMLGAVAAVAKQSTHPLSRMIASQLKGYRTHAPEMVQEVPGKGVAGVVLGKEVLLGRADFARPAGVVPVSEGSCVHVAIDGAYKGSFELEPEYREGIALLHPAQTRLDTHILSGDAAAEEMVLRKWFGPVPMHFKQTPEDKLAYVEALLRARRQVGMLGDGLNDAGALRAASVGIAVSDNAAMFTPAADAILEGKAMARLPRMLKMAKASLGIVQACTVLSLLYNCVGVFFAVQGELSPILAAVLMPASSIAVVTLSTVLSYRKARQLGLSPGNTLAEPAVIPA
ncbi:MAG: heavy metal translocating P-type ATPase [Bacteroidetes bacterium]|nr:heavy metal translocating P-type ATPase [Bacteroidota bacterium]